MNIRKISFLILMISTIGNSRVPKVESKEWLEKSLSFAIAFEQSSIKIEGERISCPDYTNEKKTHNIQIEDLQALFDNRVRSTMLNQKYYNNKDGKVGYLVSFILYFDENGRDLPGSIGELNTGINECSKLMDEKSPNLKKIKKEITEEARATLEKRGFDPHEIDDLVWPEFFDNQIKHAKKMIEGRQLTKDYLEKKAGSDEEREKILQKMNSEVKSNRTKLWNLMGKKNPDRKEVIELLKKPFYLGSNLS